MDLLLVLAVLMVAGVVAPVAYARWRLHRQIRIRPSTRSAAPTWWLVSTVGPAQLHRRLRRCASAARAAGTGADPSLAAMAEEAESHAVELERPLLVAARLGRAGRAEQRELDAQVRELEAFVARLAVVVRRRPAAEEPSAAVHELEARLDALEAAHDELSAIELRAGLRSRR